MSEISECVEYASNYFTLYIGEGARKCLSCYRKDTAAAYALRVFVAIPLGAVQPLLFPFISTVGIVVFTILALIKACVGEKGEWKKPAFTATLCLIGAVAFFGFLMGSASGYFTLYQSVQIALGAVAINIVANAFLALRNHTPPLDEGVI